MPKAEVGSTKYLNNKLKSKGLQRLRWFCQACEKQCRDENGFRCHTQSEGHVRQMLLIGQDAQKHIQDYSGQFQRDFLQLLRTSHGEKKININHFYQEYIHNKEHIHMNATRWPSLTEFAKYLGREGICRVEEGDKGLEVAWIDNSPEALRRQDAIRKKERQDKGDEEREQRQLREQIERAREVAPTDREADDERKALQQTDGEKVKLVFGSKHSETTPALLQQDLKMSISINSDNELNTESTATLQATADVVLDASTPTVKIPFLVATAPKNVFATKKNAFGGKKSIAKEVPKKMTEQERIMMEEKAAMEHKRMKGKDRFDNGGAKRQKIF